MEQSLRQYPRVCACSWMSIPRCMERRKCHPSLNSLYRILMHLYGLPFAFLLGHCNYYFRYPFCRGSIYLSMDKLDAYPSRCSNACISLTYHCHLVDSHVRNHIPSTNVFPTTSIFPVYVPIDLLLVRCHLVLKLLSGKFDHGWRQIMICIRLKTDQFKQALYTYRI